MKKNFIFCMILLIAGLSFLPIHAVSPDEQYFDSVTEHYYTSERNCPMAHIVNARYHSDWDSGIDIESDCKVDLKTREVFDIEMVDVEGFDLEILEGEWVEIDGIPYTVTPKSEMDVNSNGYWRED